MSRRLSTDFPTSTCETVRLDLLRSAETGRSAVRSVATVLRALSVVSCIVSIRGTTLCTRGRFSEAWASSIFRGFVPVSCCSQGSLPSDCRKRQLEDLISETVANCRKSGRMVVSEVLFVKRALRTTKLDRVREKTGGTLLPPSRWSISARSARSAR